MTRNSQILNNLPLVHYVLGKMTIDFNDYDDLTSEGIIGLINAVDNYNKDKNIAFSTYAYTCIRNQVLYYLNKTKIICISLDTKIGKSITLIDTIADNESLILEKMIYKELVNDIKIIIKNILSEGEKYIISSLYGIGIKKKNQTVLAGEFECKQGTISKKHSSILLKLKQHF